jgi:hypothetical protein
MQALEPRRDDPKRVRGKPIEDGHHRFPSARSFVSFNRRCLATSTSRRGETSDARRNSGIGLGTGRGGFAGGVEPGSGIAPSPANTNSSSTA